MTETTRRWLGAMVLGVTVLSGAGPVEAAEIHVLSAGAVRSIVTELAQAFERATGHKVSLQFGTVGVTRKRLATDPADVVIMSDVAIDESIKQDALVAGSRTDIARTGIGVGVRDGAPKAEHRDGGRIQAGTAGNEVHHLRRSRSRRDQRHPLRRDLEDVRHRRRDEAEDD